MNLAVKRSGEPNFILPNCLSDLIECQACIFIDLNSSLAAVRLPFLALASNNFELMGGRSAYGELFAGIVCSVTDEHCKKLIVVQFTAA